MNIPRDYKLPKGHVLILRSCKSNLQSEHNNFQYPEDGLVECPDWVSNRECGNGLHGYLWGKGDMTLRVAKADAMWLVIEVSKKDMRRISWWWPTGNCAKVKFKSGTVIYSGTFDEAFPFIRDVYEEQTLAGSLDTFMSFCNPFDHSRRSFGSEATATNGSNRGIAFTTDRNSLSQTDGYSSVAIVKREGSVAFANNGRSVAIAQQGESISIAREYKSLALTCEDSSVAIADNYNSIALCSRSNSNARANGMESCAIATDRWSTAEVSDMDSIAICLGDMGKAKAKAHGTIALRYKGHDGLMRLAVGYVGEDGIKANTWYKVNGLGKFIETTAD